MSDELDNIDHHRVHMPCLDGLRGLAALIVVLGHAPEYRLDSIIIIESRNFGVLIFFVLSGFLMGYLYLDRETNQNSIFDYIFSRISRIVPLYYSVLIASYTYYHFDKDFVYRFSITQFIRCITFNGSESVFWSIGPEFQFYFLFIPLWIIYRYLDKKLLFVIFLLLVSLFSLITIKYWSGIIVFSKFHVFACGVILSIVKLRALRDLSPITIRYAQLIGLILLCLTLFNENIFYLFGYFAPGPSDNRLVYFYSSLPHLLLAGNLVFIFSYYDSVGKIVLGNSFAVMLGNFSFSIYLLHDPIFYFLNSIGLFAFLGPNTGLLISILLIIIFSSLTYSFVEVPSRKNLKTMLMDRYRFIIDNMSPSQSNL